MTLGKLVTILIHALVGWALCAAIIGIGMAITTINNALVIHAIAAPIFFCAVSLSYFGRFAYTRPLQTALIFIAVVMTLDFFVVALVINRSLAMFASPLGTWIPFGLIFLSTYLIGLFVQRGTHR